MTDKKEPKIKEAPNSVDFIPHPNTIFAFPIVKTKTDSGLILPDNYKGQDAPSPIAKILAIGENVKVQFENTNFKLEVGDHVYVDPSYLRFAEIDGVAGMILMADGIHGKLPQPK